MDYRNVAIRQMQDNKILARKLDRAVAGVRDALVAQVNDVKAGATRVLYYASCFTDEYYDVCTKQRIEDERFIFGAINLLKKENIIRKMLQLYFEIVFKRRTVQQLEYIKRLIMKANIHISATSITNQGFTLGVASAVYMSINKKLRFSRFAGKVSGVVFAGLGIYGVVQGAADSARRLQFSHPVYYNALYARELEMMYFLIEPLFQNSGALKMQQLSDDDIAQIIINMSR